MAQPYLDQLQAMVSKIDLDSRDLVCKHFFSGAALYVGQNICASLTPKGLAFKLSEERCAEIIAQGEAVPLRYFDKSPIKQGYVLIPDYQDLGDSDLSSYFEECLAHATSAGA